MIRLTVYKGFTEISSRPSSNQKIRAEPPFRALPSTGGKHPRGARRKKAKALCACETAVEVDIDSLSLAEAIPTTHQARLVTWVRATRAAIWFTRTPPAVRCPGDHERVTDEPTTALSTLDRQFLRVAVDLAREAVDDGDEAFGSLLVDAAGETLFTDRNRVSDGNATRHPELAIALWAVDNLTPEQRRTSVVYTSGEHCPMCSAAHAWVGLGRIVYASSTHQLATWHAEWNLGPGPVAALPISVVAPDIPTSGPDPDFAGEIRALHAAALGITT